MADTAEEDVLPWGTGSIRKKILQWESQEEVKRPGPKSHTTKPTPQFIQPVQTINPPKTTSKQTIITTQTIPKGQGTKQQSKASENEKEVKQGKTTETKVQIKHTTTIIQNTTTTTESQQFDTREQTQKPSELIKLFNSTKQRSNVDLGRQKEEERLHAPELVALIDKQKSRDRQQEVDEGRDNEEQDDIQENGAPDIGDVVHPDSTVDPEQQYDFQEGNVEIGLETSGEWQIIGTTSELDEKFDDASSSESGRASRRATLGSDVEMEIADDHSEIEENDPELTFTLAGDQEAEEDVDEAGDDDGEVDDGVEDVYVECEDEDGGVDEGNENVDDGGEEIEEPYEVAEDGDEDGTSDVMKNLSATGEFNANPASNEIVVEAPAAREYKKSVGHSTVVTDTYSAKLAALIYLRGINTKQEFCLATSVAGAGLFSDVVLKYKSDDVWKTCFIQVRHKDSVFLTPEVLIDPAGRFSLTEAFESFCEIQSKTSPSTVDEIFHGSFEDSNFVIYTNAIASEKLTLRLRPGGSPDGVDKLLGSGLNDVINLHEESDTDIFHAHPEKRDLLRKLKLHVGQPSEIDLDHLIKMELRSACSKYLSNVHIIYRFFIEAVQQWWTDDETFLTQKVNLLDKAESILNVYNLTARQKQLFKLPDVNFKPSYLSVWRDEFDKGNQLLCIQTTAMTSKFSCTKLMQCLWEADLEYIFTSLPALLSQAGEVVDEWSSGQKDLLVIVSESTDDHDDLCDDICRVFKKKQIKQLVVLSPPFDPFCVNLQSKFGGAFEELFDPYDLLQLDKESTDQILEREVRFQGCPIYLRCIIGDDLERTKNVLSANNFDTILYNTSLNVGVDVVERPELFVPRSIQRRDAVDRRIMQADDFWGIIAVSNITVEELKTLVTNAKKVGRVHDLNSKDYRYMALDSLFPEQEYNQLCETRKDVHWLHMKDGLLLWRRSQRNLTSIARFIGDTMSTHSPETILDLDDRVILVVADPKSGWSLQTSHLAVQTKQADPSLWVIQVHLDQLTTHIENATSEEFNVIDFLALVCVDKEANELERDLLRYGVEERGNVAVFLDGLDAIVPRYLRASLALLSGLLRTKIGKIFITVQPSLKEMLESHLATFAYNMCPETVANDLEDETDA